MLFGIEVEFTGVSRGKLKSALEEAGISMSTVTRQYNTDDYRIDYDFVIEGSLWRLVENKSVTKCGGEYGCELVSPVLDTLNSNDMAILRYALETISKLGGVVDDSCGIHIHIDTPKDFEVVKAMVLYFIGNNELVRYMGIPDSRLPYCKMFPTSISIGEVNACNTLDELLGYMYKKLGNDSEFKNSLRYYGLNLDSIKRRDTLEIRVFNSTLDYVKVLKYLMWVNLLVNALDLANKSCIAEGDVLKVHLKDKYSKHLTGVALW